MGPIVNANCKVTPGTAFDNKTNDSLYQYDYTPSSTKEILTWTKAKICLPSPSRRSPYSIFTHTSDLLLYFFFLCLMFGFLHLIWFIETRGDGFLTRGELVCLFYYFFFLLFFFFVWCLDFCIWFVPFWCSWWWVFNPWWWSLHLLHLGFQTHVNLQNQATNFSNRTIPTSNHISLVYLFLPMSIIVFFKTFVKLI